MTGADKRTNILFKVQVRNIVKIGVQRAGIFIQRLAVPADKTRKFNTFITQNGNWQTEKKVNTNNKYLGKVQLKK